MAAPGAHDAPGRDARTTVSVVVPAFRAAGTIDAALASVAAQSLPPDEVIVVDDASDDDTSERAQRWQDRLPLVVLRNEVNLRVGRTRARGIATATGDLIAPLDADDVWLPDHLETLVPLGRDLRTIVAARRLRWLPGVAIARHEDVELPDHDVEGEILVRNYLFAGSLFPRERLVALGKPSPSNTVDDWENWIRLIVEAGCRVAPAPTPTVLYRSSPTQVSAGEGCLPDEIELLRRLLAEPAYAAHRVPLETTLRRRLARTRLLDGLRSAVDGHSWRARSAFLDAARIDRSLRGGTRPVPHGSTTLRAMLGLASPTRAVRSRDRRLARQAIVAPANQLLAGAVDPARHPHRDLVPDTTPASLRDTPAGPDTGRPLDLTR